MNMIDIFPLLFWMDS